MTKIHIGVAYGHTINMPNLNDQASYISSVEVPEDSEILNADWQDLGGGNYRIKVVFKSPAFRGTTVPTVTNEGPAGFEMDTKTPKVKGYLDHPGVDNPNED